MLVTFALGLASGTIWELIEWTLDGTMGTTLIKGQTDTHTDLLADGLGALLGGIRLAAWSVDGGERPALAAEASTSNK